MKYVCTRTHARTHTHTHKHTHTHTHTQFEALVVRLLTEEAAQHKRNGEDEILAAFQALDGDKKGYLEQVLINDNDMSVSVCEQKILPAFQALDADKQVFVCV
jgi:anti-sigma factor ChrR (cupin superfamily)